MYLVGDELTFRLSDHEVKEMLEYALEHGFELRLPTGDYPIDDTVAEIFLDNESHVHIEMPIISD